MLWKTPSFDGKIGKKTQGKIYSFETFEHGVEKSKKESLHLKPIFIYLTSPK